VEGRKKLAELSPEWFAKHYFDRLPWDCQCEWMDEAVRSRLLLILAPAGHGKTEVISKLIVLRAICLNRNIRVLLTSATRPLAKKNLSVIKHELRWNGDLIRDFGRFYYPHLPWAKTYLTVDRTANLKDFTVEAAGITGEVTGGRFDLIIFDDVITERNAREESQREKINDFINGTALERLEVGGQAIAIGTRKQYNDWYQDLIDSPTWRVLVADAIVQEPGDFVITERSTPRKIPGTSFEVFYDCQMKGDPGRVLCPEKWTMERLLEIRATVGTVLFNREYRNIISSDINAPFKLDWLHQCRDRSLSYACSEAEIRARNYIAVIGGWDPSLVHKKKDAERLDSSYSVEVTGGITQLEPLKFDLIHLFRDRGISPGALVNKVRELYLLLRWHKLFFEANNFGDLHLYRLEDETNVPVMKHYTGGNKDDFYAGVPGMSVVFEMAQVRLPYQTPEDRALTDRLVGEFNGLGREKHDDIVMAFWIMVTGMHRFIDGLRNLRKLAGDDNLEESTPAHGGLQMAARPLSFVAQRAIAAVHRGDMVECTQAQYANEIRGALLARRAVYAEQNDVTRLQIVFQELARLDEQFRYKDGVDGRVEESET
jgi:hypothetical protein